MLRKEHGVIDFEFGSNGPCRIDVWLPAVSGSGLPVVWQPREESEGMESFIAEQVTNCTGSSTDFSSRILSLQNKPPKWDDEHKGHVLNFQGRVTESSVKNFQLCCKNAPPGLLLDPDEVVLQFGRVGKHLFNMDFKFPLSPLQAFSICVACLDGKLADRKGYVYLRKLQRDGGTAVSETVDDLFSTSSMHPPLDEDLKQGSGTVQGSMQGSSSITGMFRDAIPSSRYLKDKINRTFK